jgi:hypothetical protein
MLDLRDNIPKTHALAVAEFATLREKLLKIGARLVETASRIRLALATACPHAGLFRHRLAPCSPRALNGGVRAPHPPIPATPTRSKRTDALPNCAKSQTAHKTIDARQLGE